MQDGLCFRLEIAALPINEKDYGFLLTPIKFDAGLAYSLKNGFSRSHAFGTLSEQILVGWGLRITAAFVERMMGWPEKWTELHALETVKFRLWLQQHGEFSTMD